MEPLQGNTAKALGDVTSVKRIGFLSYGHWQPIAGSTSRTVGDALLLTIDLAIAAEELGIDGA